jgi:hypothetical protein
MWEYISIASLIFMTWYDNLWLMKFEQYAKRKGISLGWMFMKWYARREKNEMIKDGYHVDSAYLYVHEPEFIKQYDMLRIFRDLIRDEIIKQDRDLNIWDFVEACCDPDTNFDKVNKDFYHILEVNYTFDHKKYKMIYDTSINLDIRFPIYTEKEIRDRDVSKAGVNLAYLTHFDKAETNDPNAKDVTNDLKKVAGPMQNFYKDTDYVMKKEWFLDPYLGSGKLFDSNEECYMHIIDFKGNCHVIHPNQQIISLK